MYINHEKYALVNGVMLDGTRDMTPRTGLAVCVWTGTALLPSATRPMCRRAMRAWTWAANTCCRG